MRILLDYRPALRARTGVGEYVHQLARALAAARVDLSLERRAGDRRAFRNSDDVEVFTSSWKDRPAAAAVADLGNQVGVIDRRVPVRLLNIAWQRLGWPSVELLTGHRYDVVHSPHPLLLPTRAARVCTIHDLDFLLHPERTPAEFRGGYADLAQRHALEAHGVIVPTQHIGRLVQERLSIPGDRLTVCHYGVPEWSRPVTRTGSAGDRYLLFLGTLHPRKNIGGLLDAYGRLLSRVPDCPRLVLAGNSTPDAQEWLTAMAHPPLAGHVEYRGYVPDAERQALLEGAHLLVLPSYDEGFGFPVVEAMSLGIPVIVSNRGSLPEVAGDAALVIDPEDPEALVAAFRQVLEQPSCAHSLSAAGLQRAEAFTWSRAAAITREAYDAAIERRREEARVRREPMGSM